jgi:hypothetical protein
MGAILLQFRNGGRCEKSRVDKAAFDDIRKSMFIKSEANAILKEIKEPALTAAEFKTMQTANEIYSELAKVIQDRGGAGSAFYKLRRKAYENGVILQKKEFSNVFIGAVLE